eukprot:g6818.t1
MEDGEAFISGTGLDAAFETFRHEYDRLNRALVRSLEVEGALLKQCRELKADLLDHAKRLKVAHRLQAEEEKTMAVLRDEAAAAWKAARLAAQRELTAQTLIDDLQAELRALRGQGRAAQRAEVRRALDVEDEMEQDRLLELEAEAEAEMGGEGAAEAAAAGTAMAGGGAVAAAGAPHAGRRGGRSRGGGGGGGDRMLSFRDWKTANNIWTPSYPQPFVAGEQHQQGRSGPRGRLPAV